ncbi:MAG TPA: PAS domain-containing protein, partial [Mariniphaga sp.]|nr:PAS domain-containing protein [Mariniphaga sp.]
MSIRDIKQKHNLLVNNIPGVIYALDKHGYFTFVSDSVQEVLGYGTDELIGRHFSYVIHPNDIQSVSREFLLPRFNGITTGSDRSPKLFDERRSFPRITNKLKVRLRSKSCKEKTGEQVLFCTVNSSGQYSTKTNGKKVFCGTAGIIFDVNAEKISLSLLEHSKYSVLD